MIKRLPRAPLKKIIGFEEIYTVGVRKVNDVNAPFRRIPYSRDFWYADPLLFDFEGKTYLFTEAFDRKQFIGRIAVSDIDSNGSISKPQVIIKEKYHLSFPYVFQWGDDIYMIPESCANLSINLYRCTDYPLKWELAAQFATSNEFVDAVVFVMSDEKICLLGSEVNPDNPLLVRYCKYYINKADAGFVCHKDDEFQTDWNHGDRNGGKPVGTNDGLIVPTQESSSSDYGVRVNLRRVCENFIPAVAVEKSIGIDDVKFDPPISLSDAIGVHTYSAVNGIEVTDLRYLKFSADTNLRRICHLLKRHKS